jgi:large repetitive protein
MVRIPSSPRLARKCKSQMLAAIFLVLAAAGAQGQSVFAAPQPVNIPTAAQAVTVTAQVAGAVSTVEVLTLGVSNLEFAKGSVALNCESANLSLAVGASCQESVVFTPAFPGLRVGAVVLLDSNNNVLGVANLSGTGLGGLGVFVPGSVMTVAGVYRNWSSTQNGIPAIEANFEQPSSIAFDGFGNLYIADSGSTHNQIRMVCAGTNAMIQGTTCPGAGIIVRIAGTGGPGYSGDGGPASASTLSAPSGIALDGAGNLYIADTGNNVIRRISATTGIISTVAGSINGGAGFAGDGGLATSAELNSPQGVTVDGAGNLFIADTANQRIRRVAPPAAGAPGGIITTVAGNGNPSGRGDGKGTFSGDGQQAVVAGLSLPYAVAFDTAGNMYIPDSGNNRIRMMNPSGIISTIVGTGIAGDSCSTGPTKEQALNTPSGVAVDAAGNLYIADTQNSCIWEANSSAGTIAAVAWNGAKAFSSNGTGGPVQIYAPVGLYLDGYGNLYFTDFYDMLVEVIERNLAILNFTVTPVRQGSASQPEYQVVENDGNNAFDLSAIAPDENSALNDSRIVNPCTAGSPFMAVGADCMIGAVFAPSPTLVFPPFVTSEQVIANIDIGKQGDTSNAPLDIELIGVAAAVNSTTTTLASNNNPSEFGQIVTFTATVNTGSGTGNLTGTVSFFDGATPLKEKVALNAPPGTTSTATFTTTALSVGLHNVTATYNSDKDLNHFSSISAPLIQTVLEATATNLTSNVNPSAVGQTVTFTATVGLSNGGGVSPDGSVGFYDGATILETVAINAAGVATWSTTALLQGTHAITAIYNGDAAKQIQASTSNVLNQDVQASTSILITSTPNPSNFGAAVTLTAIITPNATAATTGVVSFLDGGRQIGTANLVGVANQAVFTPSALAAGPHSITAVYAGDSNYAASTSPAIAQIVNPVTPAIAWPTPAAITYGTALSATQLNASSDTVPGTFVYTPPLGTVLAAGPQTLSVNFLPTDSVDYGSTKATVSLLVNQASPTMTVSSSGSPSSYGAPVVFTASVSSGPTGAVTFYDGAASIGTGTVQNGKATCTTNTLAVGPNNITATWPGNANYNPVTSSPVTEIVNRSIPVIQWPSPAPVAYGTALSSTQLDATSTTAGSFTYSPAPGAVLSAGSRTLSVTFIPTDIVDYTSANATVLFQVNQVMPTITWAAPAPISYGTPLSGTQLNASSNGVAGFFFYTPSAGTVLPAGAETLSVTFLPTDTTDYSSPTGKVSLTVNKASPTMTVSSSGTPSNYGAVTFTATVSSGPTGTVTFYDGATSLGTATLQGTTAAFITSTLSVGVHVITASWAGNSNFNPVTSAPVTQKVSLAQTATGLSAVPNPAIAGLATSLAATVKLTAGMATPTGAVTFTDTFKGATVPLGTVTLVTGGAGDAAGYAAGYASSGTATINPMLAPGIHSIAATYSGDADSAASASSQLALTVNQATTAVTIVVAPNPAMVLTPIALAATVTGNGGAPTGTVNFYANGTTLLGAATLETNGTATIQYAPRAVGSFQLTAVYAGDTNDASATSSTVSLAVGSIPTASALGSSSTGGASPTLILEATVVGASGPTPTGTVKFTSGSSLLGSASLDATGVATLNPNLSVNVSYTIVADYGGDALHSPSTSAPLERSGTPTDYSVTVTPAKLTLARSQNATVSVSMISHSDFTDTIGLGCASLPAGVSCHFSAINFALAANTTQAVQLTIDTSNPLGGGASAMLERPGNRDISLAGVLIPPFLFGCFYRRSRRKLASIFISTLLLLSAAALITGCGGITQVSAAPGTYVIQVFGAGVNSNITHFQNVTLTITQ